MDLKFSFDAWRILKSPNKSVSEKKKKKENIIKFNSILS